MRVSFWEIISSARSDEPEGDEDESTVLDDTDWEREDDAQFGQRE